MQILELDSWGAFVSAIKKLKSEYVSHKVLEFDVRTRILFRGQAKAKWPLQTTLERYSSREWPAGEYVERVLILAPQIESFTGRLPSQGRLKELLKAAGHRLSYDVPCKDYLAHLRHNGFPSPLLDWTESPHIAAFFAMAKENNAERASVFVYVDQPTGGKSGKNDPKNITVIGPYVKTHRRHSLQKSCYSICTQNKGGEVRFSCHEGVFAEGRTDQDLLYKITLPRALRLDFLQRLHEMEIDEETLFDTEDTPMQTLAGLSIELDGH